MTVGDPAFWDDFFALQLIPMVLDLVVDTWGRISKPGPAEYEDATSVRLYSAMVNGKDRQKHPFLVLYQAVEVDTDLSKETGRKDIVFFPSSLEDIYFCLEAKRLNALVSGEMTSLAHEYVTEGMQRFVDGKYSGGVRHGGMLGYVLDGDITRAIENVSNNLRLHQAELRMAPPGTFLNSNCRPDDLCARETQHQRAQEDVLFRIHHLFVAGGGQATAPGQRPRTNADKPRPGTSPDKPQRKKRGGR